MEIQGKIVEVLPLQSGTGKASGKDWSKQEYILETLDSQYPKKICFNLWGDRIGQFNLQVGEDVTVQIDIESREFNGRWYTDVRAWRVDRGLNSLNNMNPMGEQSMPQSGHQQAMPSQNGPGFNTQQMTTPQPSSGFTPDMGGDDLPF